MRLTNDVALLARAVAAYTTHNRGKPDLAASYTATHDGLHFVVLRGRRGILAVYQLRANNWLRRLERVPDWLEQ